MDDFSQSVLQKAEDLLSKIEEKRNLIVLYEVMFHQTNQKKYTVLFSIQGIIHHCLQYGNYLRACRYILVAENLLRDFEKNEHILKYKVTNYFVKGKR